MLEKLKPNFSKKKSSEGCWCKKKISLNMLVNPVRLLEVRRLQHNSVIPAYLPWAHSFVLNLQYFFWHCFRDGSRLIFLNVTFVLRLHVVFTAAWSRLVTLARYLPWVMYTVSRSCRYRPHSRSYLRTWNTSCIILMFGRWKVCGCAPS